MEQRNSVIWSRAQSRRCCSMSTVPSAMVSEVCCWSCCGLVHRGAAISLQRRFQPEGRLITGRLHSSPALTVPRLEVLLRWKPRNIHTLPFSIFTHKWGSICHNSQNNHDNSTWNVTPGDFLFYCREDAQSYVTDVWFSPRICGLERRVLPTVCESDRFLMGLYS